MFLETGASVTARKVAQRGSSSRYLTYLNLTVMPLDPQNVLMGGKKREVRHVAAEY